MASVKLVSILHVSPLGVSTLNGRTEEPGMLQYMWSKKVRHDSVTKQQIH